LESAMSTNPYYLDARLTAVFTIHAVCLLELESVLFLLLYLDYGGTPFFPFLSAVPPRRSGSVAATRSPAGDEAVFAQIHQIGTKDPLKKKKELPNCAIKA